jgi:hypothetical protein
MRKHDPESLLSEQRFATAYAFKILAPPFLFLVMHLAYALLFEVDHPLLRIAAQAEWLLISALVLLDAAIELRAIGSRYDKLLGAGAMLVFLLFGTVKYTIGHPAALSATGWAPDELGLLTALSFFTSAVTLCSIITSIYVFLLVSRELTVRKLTRMVL